MDENTHLKRKSELVDACEGADRLEVVRAEIVRANANDLVFARISGATKLKEFISIINFKEKQTGASCACLGTYHLKIYKANTVVARISYQHHTALRWSGKSWIGDSALTEESTDNMLAWFAENDFREPFIEYQEAQAELKATKDRHNFVKSLFDTKAQAILETPSEDFEIGGLSTEEIGKNLYSYHTDKQKYLDIIIKVYGTQLNYQCINYYESIIQDSDTYISEKIISEHLEKNQNLDDISQKGLAILLLRRGKLTEKLLNQHRRQLAAIMSSWLELENNFDFFQYGIASIAELNIPEFNQLLIPYANGDKKLKTINPENNITNLRYLTILKLAENQENSVLDTCNELLKLKHSSLNKSILLIAKAHLTGDLTDISKQDFAHDVFILSRSRELLAERYPSTKSYDILVAGTEHNYAIVRENSVLAFERLTGKKWYQNKEHERAEWHGKDVREWWQKNRSSYVFDKKTDIKE